MLCWKPKVDWMDDSPKSGADTLSGWPQAHNHSSYLTQRRGCDHSCTRDPASQRYFRASTFSVHTFPVGTTLLAKLWTSWGLSIIYIYKDIYWNIWLFGLSTQHRTPLSFSASSHFSRIPPRLTPHSSHLPPELASILPSLTPEKPDFGSFNLTSTLYIPSSQIKSVTGLHYDKSGTHSSQPLSICIHHPYLISGDGSEVSHL